VDTASATSGTSLGRSGGRRVPTGFTCSSTGLTGGTGQGRKNGGWGRLLHVIQEDRLRLQGPGRHDGENKGQGHESPPGDPRSPGQDRGGLTAPQDALGGGGSTTHGGEPAPLPRLEKDDDSQEQSVEHQKSQQKRVHHLSPFGVWHSM